MKHTKKVSLGAGYARKSSYEFEGNKFEADIKNDDIITILDEGTEVQGNYGPQAVHKIETRNGTKLFTLNQTTINNLIDAFGDDSVNWIGKKVKVWILKVMVSGKLQNVAYLAPQDWDMNEEGKFLSPEKGDVSIDAEDIKFD